MPLTEAPEGLTAQQRESIRGWLERRLPHARYRDRKLLFRLWEECRDWHLKNGVLRASWEATFRSWLRKDWEFYQEGPAPRGPGPTSREMPQERGQRGDDFEDVGALLRVVPGGKE